MPADLVASMSVLDKNDGVTLPGVGAAPWNVFQVGTNKRSIESQGFLVGTSDTLIPLGTIGTLGCAYFQNLDPTNSIDIKDVASGRKIAHLAPGGPPAFFTPGSDVTAPVAIASTTACRMRYRIWEA